MLIRTSMHRESYLFGLTSEARGLGPICRSAVLLGAVLGLVSCGGGGSADEQSVMPCDFRASEPVLLIQSAKDSVTGSPLSSVRLTNLKYNDLPANLVAQIMPGSNAAVSGEGIDCTLPCGIGSIAGKYSFTVSASKYQQSDFSAQASYATKSNSCPVVLSNGTKVDLLLVAS